MMHDLIKLTANLKIQLRNMVVEDGFIQLLYPLPGILQTLHKYFYCGSDARIRRGFGHHGIIIKPVYITEFSYRR